MSVLTHTDVDDYGSLVAEAVRMLAPGGCFVHVGGGAVPELLAFRLRRRPVS